MSLYRISRLVRGMSGNSCKCCTDMYAKGIHKIQINQKCLKVYNSNTSTNQCKNNSWYTFVKRQKWTVPIGVGVTLLTIFQWKHLKYYTLKYSYATEDYDVHQLINAFLAKCYYFIPFRTISRLWGWIASLELPVTIRATLYRLYAKTFDANLEEIDLDLTDFPSLVDFFVRPLKCDARPIDQNADIVSPSDGTVLYFGPVTSCSVQQVKGVTYNLKHFLGDIDESNRDDSSKDMDDNDDTYIRTLLKNPMNQLYQLTVYLAPGDYHRFHSPTDWEIEFRRHFQGKLLTVNPKIARYLPNLFSLNERVVYVGKWAAGFMAYTAVGATNVGSIKVYCDKDLHTNAIKWPKEKHWKDVNLGCTRLSKGELFGEFRMGSTIVLLFEAPKDFKFCINRGQAIKMGQALSKCTAKMEEKQYKNSL